MKSQQECVEWLISKGIAKEDVMIRAPERSLYFKKYEKTDDVAKDLQEILDKLCT